MRFLILLVTFFTVHLTARAQYAPQAGLAGSDAIAGSSSLFVGWATGCSVQRGYMDIADTSLGLASYGDSSQAIGAPDGYVVSLGDSGIATLTFLHPIFDAPGPDFAVFENGFRDPTDSTLAFLELGFVEVSSDGVHYFRFPACSLIPDTGQVSMTTYMDASKLYNLAGKYVEGYGTPFDLAELAGISGLDIGHVTSIRVVDVVGSIAGHATYDSAGRAVNDPFPTPVPSSGFDLDAVGVIHQVGTGVSELALSPDIEVYPNPVCENVSVSMGPLTSGLAKISLFAPTGALITKIETENNTTTFSLAGYPAGVYVVQVADNNGNRWVKKLLKY